MRLIPRQEKFYHLFRRHAELTVEAAAIMLDGVQRGQAAIQSAAERIRKLEHDGDDVTQEVVFKLRRTFITPIDPEDIHRLMERQDDVLDDIEECAFRLAAFRFAEVPAAVPALAETVLESCRQVGAALEALEKKQPVGPCIAEVNRLEERADKLLRDAEVALFADEGNPILLLKQKEILEWLETIADRCKDVATVLENVTVKNA